MPGFAAANSTAADGSTAVFADAETVADVESAPADADATRAFRTAIFGVWIPPLLLYALYLVIKTTGQELSPAAARKYYVALAICLLSTALWVFGYWFVFRM